MSELQSYRTQYFLFNTNTCIMEMGSKPYCLLHFGYNPPSRLSGQVLTFRSFHTTQHRPTPSCRLLATFLRRRRFLLGESKLAEATSSRDHPWVTAQAQPPRLQRAPSEAARRGGPSPRRTWLSADPGAHPSALQSCPRGAGGGGVHVPAPDNAPHKTRARADTHPPCASGCSAAPRGPGTYTRRD